MTISPRRRQTGFSTVELVVVVAIMLIVAGFAAPQILSMMHLIRPERRPPGNGEFYGSITGNTITDSGNGSLHYDKNTAAVPPSNGFYAMISYRELS